ncbi:MAG: CPBP family glutamic-type intramembrane protease [Actinomycetota bacterium]
MVPAVMVLGLVAEGTAWWVVATRGVSIWAAIIPVAGSMGIAALALGPPSLSQEVALGPAGAAGAAAGAGLYLATLGFVRAIRGWPTFREHAIRTYLLQGALPSAFALLLSMVSVFGEELFWRGLFRAHAVSGAPVASALVAWGAFVTANLPSMNLAIVSGAVVGGAAWTALALWSNGVLASLVCHGVWTALMLIAPVVGWRSEGAGE